METSDNFKVLKEQLKAYVESRLELFRLEAIDHSSYILSFIFGLLIVLAVALMFLISLGFFLGHWMGELFNNTWIGFAIVSGFYLLVFLLFYFRFKSILQHPLQNLLIKKIDQYYEEKGE